MSAKLLNDYREAYAALPAYRCLQQLTESEALEAAFAAFNEAESTLADATILAKARRQARHALTPRRLAGIRKRRPDLADVIDRDFEWLAFVVVDFLRWPFRDQVRYWYWITGVPEADGQIKSTRGSPPTWRGVRDAANVLLNWHRAARGTNAPAAWLAHKLSVIQPNMSRPSANGVSREHKLARYFLAEWKCGQT